MKNSLALVSTLRLALMVLWPLVCLPAAENLSLLGAGVGFTPSSSSVTSGPLAENGFEVVIQPGNDSYPGVRIVPDGGTWNLAAFGHVEAVVRNTGESPLRINLRVDNPAKKGRNPWNTEIVDVAPGEERTIRTIFGFHYGFKKGFPLDPAEVSALLLFTEKVGGEPASFRVKSLRAGGVTGEKPPTAPGDIRVRPANGNILGPGVSLNVGKQVDVTSGVKVFGSGNGAPLKLVFPVSGKPAKVRIRPTSGWWDLREASRVAVRVRNGGTSEVRPNFRVLSRGERGTDVVGELLPPGRTGEVVIPFAPSKPWRGPSGPVTRAHMSGEKGFGTKFESDKTVALVIEIPPSKSPGELELLSITAGDDPVPVPGPEKPPVEGDWRLTFREEFEGDAIDPEKWNVHGPNYWGARKLTHWSRENVIVRDGLAVIRLEKKRGFHNDDPSEHESDYTGGYLDTWDKWRQRYGYFEARMKLPEAPGLWPAFWMMPDWGREKGPMWKRQYTGDGAMEFDIMEHLTRWGPHRYNIAMHWDGYGKGHKSIGTSHIYAPLDEEGFLTCGLLWTPGSAVYFCNGKEVGRHESDRISNVPAMLMFTMPIGGWDNDPLDDARLPGDFLIDYVRVWQRADLEGTD